MAPCALNSAKYCLQAPVRVRTEDTTSVKDSFPLEGNIFVPVAPRLSLSTCRNHFTIMPLDTLT